MQHGRPVSAECYHSKGRDRSRYVHLLLLSQTVLRVTASSEVALEGTSRLLRLTQQYGIIQAWPVATRKGAIRMPKLVCATVTGLLDDFDHTVTFPDTWPFVLIFGPNGIGKTKLLELIDFASNMRFGSLTTIAFSQVQLKYHDDSVYTIRRLRHKPNQEPLISDDVESEEFEAILEQPDRLVPITWKFGGSSQLNSLRHYIESTTSWRNTGGGQWIDTRDGEVIEEFELLDRYRHIVSNRLRRRSPHTIEEAPVDLRNFLRSVPVRLIATQRLLSSVPTRRSTERSAPSHRKSTISEYSEEMRSLLSEALAGNSKVSQQLDRSFPRRLLSRAITSGIADDRHIRERYAQQSALRQRLTQIGLIQPDDDVPIPEDRELEDWERNVLLTYLSDTDKKLESFASVLTRVELLRKIVNTRFLHKKLTVHAEQGLVVTRNSDSRTIRLDDLSSGEQHELVLFFYLLFKVPRNALVLIDEPEISLHIAWQLSFLSDIAQVAELSALRFIIATHSPQLINKAWDRTVELVSELDSTGEDELHES